MQVPNLACILCWSRRVASPLDGSGLEEQISCHVRKEPQEIVVNVLKGVRETIISSFCGSKCSESYQSSAAANVRSLLRQQRFGVLPACTNPCTPLGHESQREARSHCPGERELDVLASTAEGTFLQRKESPLKSRRCTYDLTLFTLLLVYLHLGPQDRTLFGTGDRSELL